MTMPRLWRLPGVGSTIDLNRVANITPISDSEGELAFQIHLAGIEPVKLACKYEQHRKGSVLDAFTRMRESTLQAWAGNDSSQLHVPFSQIEYIEEPEPGVWVIKLGEFVPDNERWLHTPAVKAQLDEGLAWAARNAPRETDLNELEESLAHGSRSAARSARR